MLLEHVRDHLAEIENQINDRTTIDDVLAALRPLGLDDFGAVLYFMPDPNYPKLSGILPKMASEKVQVDWTGNSGMTLLRQTSAFVRATACAVGQYTDQTMRNCRMLDYGCGYGRIARLMLAYCNQDALFGVDPLQESINLCNKAGLGPAFRLSDYLPETLPVEGKFEVIYAFSVFTHTSKKATLKCLDTLRDYVSPDGLLVITVRPIEYWSHHEDARKPGRLDELVNQHRREGFVFVPHNWAPIDGDIVYGDTSISMAWLRANLNAWTIAGTDRSLEDSLQRYVYLKPSNRRS